jgi:hypothetical protein
MGYRSTVAYTIRFVAPNDNEDTLEKCKGTFFTFLAEAKANEATAGAFSEDDALEVDEQKMEFRFFADSVKWYESYPDVMCHEALMNLSKEWADDGDCSNPYIGGAFARIGEEMEDVIEECWGEGDYDWISVSRSMHCDWLD